MSDTDIIIGLATVVVFGVGSQWIGRRLGFPSLLLLLPAGLLAGQFDLVDPEGLFGDTLFPLVTLLVALLLFQAGLQLRVSDLPPDARRPVVRLITVGLAVTFIGCSIAVATIVAGIDSHVAFLVGAVLTVSGPTVVGPLLAEVRAREPTSSILRWEGAVLDPLGATLAVVVLNLLLASDRGGVHPLGQMAGRLGLGVAVGLVAAALLVFAMSRYLLTDDMEAAVAVLFAVAAFASAEVFLSEAGLFATVTLGIAVANQRRVSMRHVLGFGETLEVLIIGILFILLGALVELSALREVAVEVVLLVVVLVLVVRPAAAFASLVGPPLGVRDKAMIASLDPRGIVAAATAAQFTGVLDTAGIDSDEFLPIVFGVILGTGIVYGLLSAPMARLLAVVRPPPTGVAVVGDSPWSIAYARALHGAGARVLVITTEPSEEAALAYPDLPWVSLQETDATVEDALDRAALRDVVVSAAPGALVSLVTGRLLELVGRRHLHRIPHADTSGHRITERIEGRPFAGGVTSVELESRFERGALIEVRPAAAVETGGGDGGDREGATRLGRVSSDGRVWLTDDPPAEAGADLLEVLMRSER